MKGATHMDDEHSPHWKPEDQTSLIDFLGAVARGFLFAAAIAMFLTLLGCSTIDPQNKVEGWPELQVVENRVSFDDVQIKCGQYVGWGQWPMACATFYFQTAKCVIWYAFDWSLEHERQHCLGFDHPGSNDMRAMWKDWQARDHASR
jgi:hypothetical protein